MRFGVANPVVACYYSRNATKMEIQEFIETAESYRGHLLRQARHYLHDADSAEDAVQETLVKLWMAKDRIADGAKMRSMASVVCRNVCLNTLRDSKCHIAINSAVAVMGENSPQTELEEREALQTLRQGIRALSDKQRAIIRMRNVEQLPYAVIAKVMGTSESSVRGMISKARMVLLNQLKKR